MQPARPDPDNHHEERTMNIRVMSAPWQTPVLSIAALLAASPAFATTITFGTEANQAQIENYFNGGTDSQGKSGTNVGISFSNNGESLKAGFSAASGGTGLFENVPSGAPGVLFFAPITGSGGNLTSYTTGVINYASGFQNIGFNYSLLNNASANASTVTLWSGLDGTGTELGTISLFANAASVACTGNVAPTGLSRDEFCTWSNTSAQVAGVAQSAVFTGKGLGSTELDAVSLTTVPLPATLWLMVSAVGGLAGLVRRRAA
jgi:hypothetical protein